MGKGNVRNNVTRKIQSIYRSCIREDKSMAQILEFRQRTSNTYHNLTRFVEITENTATLEFYVGALELIF